MIRVTLTCRAPVAISRRRAIGFDLDTLPYIPGRAFRGAAAQAYLDSGGRADSMEFRRVFLEDKVRFMDLRNGVPAPLSFRKCSRQPEYHASRDQMWSAILEGNYRGKCSCGAKMIPETGFLLLGRDGRDAAPYSRPEVKTRRLAHSQVDPQTLSVMAQQFHSSRVIEGEEVFEGSVTFADDAAGSIGTVLRACATIYLGRGRTRGQGRAEVSWIAVKDPDRSMEQRLETFNQAAARAGKRLFSCTFRSDGIFVDRWLRSKLDLTGSDLDERLTEYRVCAAFAQQTLVAGWNAATGFPKAEVHAIAAGSVYVFEGDAGALSDSALASVLAELEHDGVGERLSEGFGEVRFCDELHLAMR
jgi:CRISPR-associated protein Csx10